jgi:two-component system cell cycle sensor histidine kinase/response regulator CckA
MLRSILRMNGYRVLVAGTSNDALRICTQFRRPIDLMITDVAMPGFSGFVLADEVARNRPRMPILFISGGFDRQDYAVRDVLHAGREFLEKPFTGRALASKLKSMIATGSPQETSRA